MKTDIDKQITRVFQEFTFFSISWPFSEIQGQLVGLR